MICIECGRPVNDVYKEFGKAGSGNIRLTRCSHCNQIADKYVEFDFIIVFLDLFLHKAQAYRHLLFNRQEYRDLVLIVYIFFESFMAIILSSFGKGFLILMMIWDYPFSFSTILSIFVLTSNVVSIKGKFS
ncbi:hypothetical protein PPL_00835 [Heterostelium album PN500]|uniref:Protein ARV n=1 Tax=Heterostelium pallidum (strain ATCC 26659 / Pp 5 / PN500) TaxID=670386 RepID=D3AXK4_HETP5|nr:hypothetical protein PPL_00835 [Heterostelium album PN500]EFA86273.1 hypothetical protein PPL_00835 [Heterostelium album PN500]|eukprot:XP_020438378.1 hypothetical protein PPL_00835 [Heterostelium album PN500]